MLYAKGLFLFDIGNGRISCGGELAHIHGPVSGSVVGGGVIAEFLEVSVLLGNIDAVEISLSNGLNGGTVYGHTLKFGSIGKTCLVENQVIVYVKEDYTVLGNNLDLMGRY